MILNELEQGLKTSFFEKNHKSDHFYQTKLVTNTALKEKVINTFESELATCTVIPPFLIELMGRKSKALVIV